MESVFDSDEEKDNIYEELHGDEGDIPDDVTVYEEVDSEDSEHLEREKSLQDMKSIIKVRSRFLDFWLET